MGKAAAAAAEKERKSSQPPAGEEDPASGSENEEEDEEVDWWEQENIEFAQRGEKRWDTLEHNGVLFPPRYVPHGVPFMYDGVVVPLTPEEEEVATMFAVMKESEYYRKPLFRRNFFADWRKILDKRSHPIKVLELCDFEAIYQHHLSERAKAKNMPRDQKKALKIANDKLTEPFKFCMWNGKKEQVANFRVEPPGLFRGRGEHPLQGKIKQRVEPEDITINCGVDAKVPTPPEGHKWAEVRHDNTVTWLAMWKDNVTDNHKYVMLNANSTVKGMSDMMKFEKARKLKNHIDTIRKSYQGDFYSKDKLARQRAVCVYFIDKLALRVGNEKSDDEADTVGCTSLRWEHVMPEDGNKLRFSFLGKDSVPYENTVEVEPIVYELVTQFRSGGREGKQLFDLVTPAALNDHLKNFMEGLTAKVFRTYNASVCLQQYLRDHPCKPGLSEADKMIYFNKANLQVAILCNHQRTIPKQHHAKMSELNTKLQYTKDLISRLEDLKPLWKKDPAKAEKLFYEQEDKLQQAWLDQYGTDEQKQEFADAVANRKMIGGTSVKKESRSSKVKVEDEASETDEKPAKKRRTTTKQEEEGEDADKKKTTKAKGRAATQKDEESSSEDELVAAIVTSRKTARASPAAAAAATKAQPGSRAKKATPAAVEEEAVAAPTKQKPSKDSAAAAAKKPEKAAPKKRGRAEVEKREDSDSSDDDEPLSAIVSGAKGKTAAAKSPAKKGAEADPKGKKGAQGSKKKEEESDDEDGKQMRKKATKQSPAKGSKSPPAKAASKAKSPPAKKGGKKK